MRIKGLKLMNIDNGRIFLNLVIPFAQTENKMKVADILKPVIPGEEAKRPRPGIQKK